MSLIFNVIIFLLIASLYDLCNADHSNDHWTYVDETHWPGACNSGERQSPIDISTNDVITDLSGDVIKDKLHFLNYKYGNMSVENNNHTIRFYQNHDEWNHASIAGGPLQNVYKFDALHFHWPSEHVIDGKRSALEIHFVHTRSDLSMADAQKQADGLVAVGILCEIADEGTLAVSSWSLDVVMRHVVALTSPGDQADVGPLDLERLLPVDRSQYYTYNGSLTTPECQEVVQWIVFKEKILITESQLKLFQRITISGNTTHNSRKARPSAGRSVFASPEREYRPEPEHKPEPEHPESEHKPEQEHDNQLDQKHENVDNDEQLLNILGPRSGTVQLRYSHVINLVVIISLFLGRLE